MAVANKSEWESGETSRYLGLTLNFKLRKSISAQELAETLHKQFGHGKWADKLVAELVRDHLALRSAGL